MTVDNMVVVRIALGVVSGLPFIGRDRHGRWPLRVRLFSASLADIRDHLFAPEDYDRILTKVALVVDQMPMVAEDDCGASYSYGQEGIPGERPSPSAAEWLGVRPRREG